MKSYASLCKRFKVHQIGSLRWAHAVNSKKELDEVVGDDSIHVVEGDVSSGANGDLIMAHPPKRGSDLTLHDWVGRLVASGKGIKVDLKSPDCFEECLRALQAIAVSIPVIVNADVLCGPAGKIPLWDPLLFMEQ